MNISQLHGGKVEALPSGSWRLSLPVGGDGEYRLSQVDDYKNIPRRNFPHTLPFRMNLQARISGGNPPGTWGFGFWNDPFVMGLGLPGTALRLPTLPNAVWFFHASPENYLSFLDSTPGNGMLAGIFSSPSIPSIFSLAALPFAPLLFAPPVARGLRRLASSVIHEQLVQLDKDWTAWHSFEIHAGLDRILFYLDGNPCLESRLVPTGRLGFVCWMDNQFLSFTPGGKLQFGTLSAMQAAWLEITNFDLCQG